VKHLLTAAVAVASIAVLGGPVAAQSPSPGAAAPAELTGDETAPIVVWLDETRVPAIDAWKAAHPDQADLVTAEVVDILQIPAKIALANNAGKGWPDVVFNGANLIAMTATPRNDWAMDLAPYVSQDTIDQFEAHVIAECQRPDGTLICLSNDIAQSVLYYNKPLMDEFGYEVPTTWEELAALGEKVAVEHPGYLIGAFGDALSLDMYFWTARCATGQLKGEDTVYINVLAPECVRAAQWVDRMQQLGVVAKVGTFDPTFIDAANKDKLLILTAPSWFGEFVFGGTPDSVYYTEAKGQLGVAAPPKWEADEQPYFGGQGGAAWAVSKHAANPKLAVDLVTWLATAPEYQVDLAPTYPAFKPPAAEWVKRIATNPLYANDPGPVYIEAAAYEDPLFGIVTYDTATIFTTAVIGALNEGKSVESSLPAFQDALVQAAQTAGYTVVTEP
jgi:ABC-type glycerol-3-phosphate transport system substrate-binding protein